MRMQQRRTQMILAVAALIAALLFAVAMGMRLG
jgi:hypothetical protein